MWLNVSDVVSVTDSVPEGDATSVAESEDRFDRDFVCVCAALKLMLPDPVRESVFQHCGWKFLVHATSSVLVPGAKWPGLSGNDVYCEQPRITVYSLLTTSVDSTLAVRKNELRNVNMHPLCRRPVEVMAAKPVAFDGSTAVRLTLSRTTTTPEAIPPNIIGLSRSVVIFQHRRVKFRNCTCVSLLAKSIVLPKPPLNVGDVTLITAVPRADKSVPLVMLIIPSVAVELPTAVTDGDGTTNTASDSEAPFKKKRFATGKEGATLEKENVTSSPVAVREMVPCDPPEIEATAPVAPAVVRVVVRLLSTTEPEAEPTDCAPSLRRFSVAERLADIMEMLAVPLIPAPNLIVASLFDVSVTLALDDVPERVTVELSTTPATNMFDD